MSDEEFRYCIRMELGRQQGSPVWMHFLRGLAKTLAPWKKPPSFSDLPPAELIFTLITENHLKHFRPVAAELNRQGKSYLVLFTGEYLYRKCASEWPGKSFLLPAFIGRIEYARAAIFQLKRMLRHIRASVNDKACIIKFGIPANGIYRVMLEILKKNEGCKVALFKAEGYQANAVLLACRKSRIPTFAIQHGLISESAYFAGLAVDRYLVWSDFFKKRLEASQAGCRIIVTGNAASDSLFNETDRSGISKPPATPLRILILPNSGGSHTPLSHVHLLLSVVLEFAQEHPEASITVKPHPADHTANVQAFLAPNLNRVPNIRLLDRFDPVPYNGQHLIAINNSGAGMEAAIREIPMLVVAPHWGEVMVEQYIENGIALFAATTAQFGEGVARVMADPEMFRRNCREFIRVQLEYRGKAAEKIVRELTC